MLGADVVGMSTVPEAIVANYLKMDVIAFSMVTNHATGVSDNKLSHQEVLECGKIAGSKLSGLIKEIIKANGIFRSLFYIVKALAGGQGLLCFFSFQQG
jgi:purine-nucleoside phosphorylase